MAVNTFSSHLSDLGGRLQELDDLLSTIDQIMERHTANGYSTLTEGNYTGEQVTKTEYDNATSSMANLVGAWRTTHGGNIQNYLYEIPETP